MKLLTTFATTLLAFSISTTAIAAQEKLHTTGVQFGGGGLEYKKQDTDGEGVVTSYLYYNYKFLPNYTLEVGLLSGSDLDWDCDKTDGEWECFSDNDRKNNIDLDADKLSLDALVVAIKTDLALSKRNSLYAKLGASFYDYQLSLNNTKEVDESGVGLMLEGGWEYRWDMGIGMNVGLQYQKMGDLKANTLNVGVSYSF